MSIQDRIIVLKEWIAQGYEELARIETIRIVRVLRNE